MLYVLKQVNGNIRWPKVHNKCTHRQTNRQTNTLTVGSREMMRTVWSDSPTAKNLERCSPGGTAAKLRQDTSADISRRSVYSFSWPAYQCINTHNMKYRRNMQWQSRHKNRQISSDKSQLGLTKCLDIIPLHYIPYSRKFLKTTNFTVLTDFTLTLKINPLKILHH